MKELIAFLLIMLTLTGCGGRSAKMEVENHLKKYNNLNSEVLVDLETIMDEENLTESQKEKYRDIMKKQYKDLSYKVIEEEYDDEVSYITVEVEVYDLYKVQDDASIYLENNTDEFKDEEGLYDKDKFIDYKLDKMKDVTDRKTYTITFTVTNEDDKYVVEQLVDEDLDKIHGVYNYTID